MVLLDSQPKNTISETLMWCLSGRGGTGVMSSSRQGGNKILVTRQQPGKCQNGACPWLMAQQQEWSQGSCSSKKWKGRG